MTWWISSVLIFLRLEYLTELLQVMYMSNAFSRHAEFCTYIQLNILIFQESRPIETPPITLDLNATVESNNGVHRLCTHEEVV